MGQQKELQTCRAHSTDPIQGNNRVDKQTDAEVAHHMEDCLTKLVSQLNVDHHLESESNNQMDPLQFMSMMELHGNDIGIILSLLVQHIMMF